jgi:hypothetical protein
MPTQTLAEAAKLLSNEIVEGVAEDIIRVNPFFNALPFLGFAGQSVKVNRENALGDVQNLAVGGTITAKAAATFTERSFAPVTIIGDAEMNGLVQATSSGAGVNQMAIEVASKAKNIGQQWQQQAATGTGVDPQMHSLHSLVDASQYTGSSAGQAISLALLDELLDLVKSGNGRVDFAWMAPRTIRAFLAALRTAGGATIAEYRQTANVAERTIPGAYLAYRGVPIYQNDFASVVETANGAALTGGALTSVFAGVFDDGSKKLGLAGLYPQAVPSGIQVEVIGKKEAADEEIVRVKMYTQMGLFNRRGLARLPSINN